MLSKTVPTSQKLKKPISIDRLWALKFPESNIPIGN